MNNVIDVLQGIVNLFFSVFGFLPSWVQVFVGSIFVLLILLLGYKLVRG